MRRLLIAPLLAVTLVLGVINGAAADLNEGAVSTRSATAGIGYVLKEISPGAQIHGANGLAIDNGGRLLVASVFGSEITAMDSRAGHVLERIGPPTVDGPDDVAVGPDGSIYWTELWTGHVGRLAPNGDVSKQYVGVGVNPIAFSDDGRLFVGRAFVSDGLYELEPDLGSDPRVVIAPTAEPFADQLNGFDFGPDGMLYAPQPFQFRVVKIHPETGETTQVAGLPDFPSSVEFDSQGRLHASTVFGTVQRVDVAAGTAEQAVAIPGAYFDNMVFDAKDQLYVSDMYSGTVYKVSPGGGVRTLSAGGMILPGGIAVMESGTAHDSLFVADYYSLREFDARTGLASSMAPALPLPGSVVGAVTAAADGDHLILTDYGAGAVQIWDPSTQSEVERVEEFVLPTNALRFQGDLIVADLLTGSVNRRDEATGVWSVLSDQLVYPAGLAATENALYATDWATGDVVLLAGPGAPGTLAEGLQFPEGMAVDIDGTLLVVETGTGQLVRIDPASGDRSVVASDLAVGARWPSAIPSHAMSGVAVDDSGTIFVTGDLTNVIYRIIPTGQR